MENKGFTLIEMLVSLMIFAILITAAMSTFVKGFAYQKRIVEMQAVQREGSYLMETISREIRMATNMDSSQQGNSDSSVSFNNPDGHSITYCLANSNGNCTASGSYFAVDDTTTGVSSIINSSDISVSRLNFYVSGGTDTFWGRGAQATSVQPLITVVMELQSNKDPTVKLNLQSSIAMRIYTQ